MSIYKNQLNLPSHRRTKVNSCSNYNMQIKLTEYIVTNLVGCHNNQVLDADNLKMEFKNNNRLLY